MAVTDQMESRQNTIEKPQSRHHGLQNYPDQHHSVQGQHNFYSPPVTGMAIETSKEQSKMSPLHEILSMVWKIVNHSLARVVTILFLMWQCSTTQLSKWWNMPCQGQFKTKKNLSVNAEVDVLSYCAKEWNGEALRVRQMRKLPEKLLYSQGCNWIQQFSFGPEKYAGPKVYAKLRKCLEVFKNQVEMFLVGYALEVKIKVFRLMKFNTAGFQVFYPEDYKWDWHEICLLTEDDRQYCLTCKSQREKGFPTQSPKKGRVFTKAFST
ncbi:hypothetical protein FKM82_006529 [Ascaphus truei]